MDNEAMIPWKQLMPFGKIPILTGKHNDPVFFLPLENCSDPTNRSAHKLRQPIANLLNPNFVMCWAQMLLYGMAEPVMGLTGIQQFHGTTLSLP
jgi:hypothetical protein